MARRRVNLQRRRYWRIAFVMFVLLCAFSSGLLYWIFARSLPMLEGRLHLPGLKGSVEIERDTAGVATIRAADRLDLASALGFLHGQERFFQMDLLRRAGAGEMSALVGPRALEFDQTRRRHRFRNRAMTILAQMANEQRALLDAYVVGVNAGLAALRHSPFEYSLLRVSPTSWQASDTLLVVYAMYFDLEESDGWSQQRRALLRQTIGPSLVEFLYPSGNPHEAPLDGSIMPVVPFPLDLKSSATNETIQPPDPVMGSNSFAVTGDLSGTGAAIIANDQHLSLRMPNIWYRARLVQIGATSLDISGSTLPGLPFIVTGSNTHIAWGFTNSYIATGDAIIIDSAPNNKDYYMTPEGPKLLQTITEPICIAHVATHVADCRDMIVEETIWGPVVARSADGRRIVWRWLAHDLNAIDFKGEIALERAQTVRAALDAAHILGLPPQNFLVGDTAGHIAWSIAGPVPKRVSLEDGLPKSWADGTRGWRGYLPPEEVPEIVDPAGGRLWTANNRIVGGESLARLGDGGYDQGDRALQVRDDLLAKTRFTEIDLLAIQLDDRAIALTPWRELLLAALDALQASEPRFALMRPYVQDWGARASPDSVGYRLVCNFQSKAVSLLYAAYTAPISQQAGAHQMIPRSSTWPAERLLRERPANLVPPPYKTWDEFTRVVLGIIDGEVGSDLKHFTWGRQNHVGIHHPLSGATPLLGVLTDPPDIGIAGDTMMPRVTNPGFGASVRFVVSPGREATGIYEMPGGQAGNPLSPYYLAGHQDWIEGRTSAFLPGVPRWRLVLEP